MADENIIVTETYEITGDFSGKTSANGGAIYVDDGTVNFATGTISYNTAGLAGGGLYVVYTGAHKLYEECLPFIRPLYYDYPNDNDSYVNPQEYLLGDHMLSAPITEPGRGSDWLASQVVYFPSDGWADYFTGESYDKGYALVSRGIMEMPLFVKKGTPLPLGRMGKRMADLPETIDLMIFPTDGDGEGSFALYEDDGITPNYKKGDRKSVV